MIFSLERKKIVAISYEGNNLEEIKQVLMNYFPNRNFSFTNTEEILTITWSSTIAPPTKTMVLVNDYIVIEEGMIKIYTHSQLHCNFDIKESYPHAR